jgi:hypothetical protein
LAVASNYPIAPGLASYPANRLLETIEPSHWQYLSAGKGSKDQCYYHWMRLVINSVSPKGWARWLLIRWSINDDTDVAFYIAFARTNQSLQAMASAAGSRWTIEECFEMAKGDVGLEQYEVRRWVGWYRHITLSMLARAFLTALRSQLIHFETQGFEKKPIPADACFFEAPRIGLIHWTVQEARRFFIYLCLAIKPPIATFLQWSWWRRMHQAIARFYHYRKREALILKLQL